MPETTEKYHRVPATRKKKNAVIRTITVSKGIKALYDVKNKVIVTYLFDVKKYTMKKAKEWVKNHKDSGAYNRLVGNLTLIEDLNYLDAELKAEVMKVVKDNL